MDQACIVVKGFHKKFGVPIGTVPKLPDTKRRYARRAFLAEEVCEYVEAEDNNDIVKIADALGDIIYIAIGTAVEYGIPIGDIFFEIHASNMSKLGANGDSLVRADGKVIKGPNYFKPRIAAILKAASK